jgi:hypothetical protein
VHGTAGLVLACGGGLPSGDRAAKGWPMTLEPGLAAAFGYTMTEADTAAAIGSGQVPVLATRGCWPWPSGPPWPWSPAPWRRV